MNIDTAKLHKLEILKAIKVHIQTHPGLADDPPLLSAIVQRQSANRALLEHKVKNDPPAQYKILWPGGPKGDEIAEPADTEDMWYPGIQCLRRNGFESAQFTLYNANSKAEDEPNASDLNRMHLI
ncbi:hypothetical protein B0H14DRAFT_2653579 [Mycena olivaceomarginata]|nr:hypothetical protein B0H14DRAFT_2653579 [Mycena olivaceomarginata]